MARYIEKIMKPNIIPIHCNSVGCDELSNPACKYPKRCLDLVFELPSPHRPKLTLQRVILKTISRDCW